MTMDFIEKVQSAKAAFNEYAGAKNKYEADKIPPNEQAMKDTLSAFLRGVLDTARVLYTLTDTKTERELLKQFTGELLKVFK